MKPVLLVLFLSFFAINYAHGQNDLRAKGENIYLDGKKMKPAKVRDLFAASPEALAQYKSARTISGINFGISFAGGACIGWELGTLISQGYINGIPLAIGCGLVATGIVLQVVINKKVAQSVVLYNDRNKTASMTLQYGFVGSGVGVALGF